MEMLQLVSIVLEAVIAGLFVLAAHKRRGYLYGLALTFGIYVAYDLSKLYMWDISPEILPAMFFVATLAALYSAWNIYKRA